MKIAFVIYDQMTTLDFIGVYDPIARLKTMGFIKDLSWEICAYSEKVHDGYGLEIIPTQVGQDLSVYDLVVVPGGVNTLDLLQDAPFLNWLATAKQCPLKASVCSGALLFGKLGFLKGKKATTHPSFLNELKPFCSQVLSDRILDAGNVITAGGVTSGIDLGLYLCEKFAGKEVRVKIAKQMDYKNFNFWKD